ncbi:hypothetical protein LCGC14_0365560 [marine sediment metagenome]|uniref:Scaffolding protein n=1 Tax=marine sediment metagenome TaxID=412755 RepID=A0A0F9T6R9_9ZZZZ
MSESDNVNEGETPRASTPNDENASTSTVTKEEAKKLVIDALAEQGRLHKVAVTKITEERDTLQRKTTKDKTRLEGVDEERKSLQQQIDELSSDDLDKSDYVKKLRGLKEEEQKLKDRISDQEDTEERYGERIKKVEAKELEDSMRELVEEYENGDLSKLETLRETADVTSIEQIRKLADTIWSKKEEPSTPVIEPFSGETEGGAESSEQKTLKKMYPTMFPK